MDRLGIKRALALSLVRRWRLFTSGYSSAASSLSASSSVNDRALLDAAQRLQAAAFAGLRVFARVNLRAAIEKSSRELFDVVAPVDEQFGSEAILD